MPTKSLILLISAPASQQGGVELRPSSHHTFPQYAPNYVVTAECGPDHRGLLGPCCGSVEKFKFRVRELQDQDRTLLGVQVYVVLYLGILRLV